MDKCIIVGFPKCGTTSLEAYLSNKGVDVLRHESLFCAGEGFGSYHTYNPIEWYKQNASDREIVFILREPVERIFSLYNYKRHHQEGDHYQIKESLKDALLNRPYLVEQSNYDKYLDMWQRKTVLYYEDIIKEADFPKHNSYDSKLLMTDEDKDIILKSINYKIHQRYV